MSVLTTRGGIPHVFRASITTAGRSHKPPFICNYLIIRTDVAVKMYFTEADFTADANYVLVPAVAATDPYGEWRGPCELQEVWFKSGATSVIELVVFQRRG